MSEAVYPCVSILFESSFIPKVIFLVHWEYVILSEVSRLITELKFLGNFRKSEVNKTVTCTRYDKHLKMDSKTDKIK